MSSIRSEDSAPYGSSGNGEEAIIRQAAEILKRRLERLSDVMSSPDLVTAYLRHEVGGELDEHFIALYLDTRHRLIKAEVLFRGTIDGAAVYPRVVARKSLEYNAAAVILAHNHPSGNLSPSISDFAITKRLKDALQLIDVRLLDHIIVSGGNDVYSMAERGDI